MAKKKNNTWKWLLAIGLILIAALYYQTEQTPEKAPAPGPGYKLEKSGAGVVLDFTETAARIHAAVDRGLANAALAAGLCLPDRTAGLDVCPCRFAGPGSWFADGRFSGP